MNEQQPFFSIVVPTFGRPRQLAGCLQSLAHLDYPRDRFEVIVVDDGSEVSPVTVVDRFRAQIDARLVTQRHAGPAAARNTGASQANGSFLAFTDDDCKPARDWLQMLAARFALMPGCAIGGRTLNTLDGNRYSTASQLLIDYLYSYYDIEPDRARFLTSNNLALPRERFSAIGGFDAGWTRVGAEDRELCDRWVDYGYRMIYAPEVLVYHAHPLSLRSFWRQHYNYGRGAYFYHCSRARRGHEHIKLEPLTFYFRLLRYPFLKSPNTPPVVIATLLLIAQTANAAGFFREKNSWMRVEPQADYKAAKPGSVTSFAEGRKSRQPNSSSLPRGGPGPAQDMSPVAESARLLVKPDIASVDGNLKGSVPASFLEQLEAAASAVDGPLCQLLQGEPRELYVASSHYIDHGGKRLRPFLLMKSCELLGGAMEAALPVAAAVELIHNFSLIHDDIMDDDEVRHAVPTVHKQYGMPLAILAGDTLLVKAFQSITNMNGNAGLPADVIVELLVKLTQTCVEMSEGQALDIGGSRPDVLSDNRYIDMIGKKTGALFQTSCELGALCVRAHSDHRKNLARFGRNLGIAFQITDDLLGVAGNPKLTHKPVGTDLREGKKTLPILLALKKAQGADRETLLRVFGSKTCSTFEIKRALRLFTDMAIDAEVRSIAKLYAGKAMDALKPYSDSAAKQALQAAVDFVVGRTA